MKVIQSKMKTRKVTALSLCELQGNYSGDKKMPYVNHLSKILTCYFIQLYLLKR